jgi:ribosome-binding protein aMBF1 (putative translation factor)
MRLYIKGLHQLFDKKCKMCPNPLPYEPDFINIDGKEVAICKECGDVLDAMNTMKTGDTSWLEQ